MAIAVCLVLVVAHLDQFVNVCVGAGCGFYYMCAVTLHWHCIVFRICFLLAFIGVPMKCRVSK